MSDGQRTTIEYGLSIVRRRIPRVCEGNGLSGPIVLLPQPGEGIAVRPDFSAIVRLQGPEDRVIFYVEQLARTIPVTLNVDISTTLPSDAWDHLPPRFLTAVQQGIVREDLRMTKRTLIAAALFISPNTITAYRTTIRKKFLTIPEEQRPLWMHIWLRRFPGNKVAPRRVKEAVGDRPPEAEAHPPKVAGRRRRASAGETPQ
ncbi:MAG TPA: hypothetical protein VFS21_31790 [Roseiflexaceae bacterium]|nr:hypothetical protein [Roseiflexaceae bacterium]